MTDRKRTDFIRVLEHMITFVESAESDFKENTLHHPGKADTVNFYFQNILNSRNNVGDIWLMIDHRILNLQDYLLDISSAVREKVEKRILFSNRAVEEVGCLFRESKAFLKSSIDFLRTDSPILLRWLENKQTECKNYCDDCATSHEERLIEGICVPAASLIYLDMLHGFSGIHWQVINIIWLLTGLYGTNELTYEGNCREQMEPKGTVGAQAAKS